MRRSAFSFLEGSCIPEDLAGALRKPRICPLWRCWTVTVLTARRVSIWPQRRPACAPTSAAKSPALTDVPIHYWPPRAKAIAISAAWSPAGAATLEEFGRILYGLICLTAHPDERLLDIFGKHALSAELRHHNREEEAHNQEVNERAAAGYPTVATNNPACPADFPSQRELLDVFTCILEYYMGGRGWRPEHNSERYVKSATKARALRRSSRSHSRYARGWACPGVT